MVHVAYQTSGNIAVSNQEALKVVEVAEGLFNSLPPQFKKLKDLKK